LYALKLDNRFFQPG